MVTKKTATIRQICHAHHINIDNNRFWYFQVEGVAWQNVNETFGYINSKLNAFEFLETDILLYGVGLVARKDYRGAKLGARLLAAR